MNTSVNRLGHEFTIGDNVRILTAPSMEALGIGGELGVVTMRGKNQCVVYIPAFSKRFVVAARYLVKGEKCPTK